MLHTEINKKEHINKGAVEHSESELAIFQDYIQETKDNWYQQP